MRHSMLDITDTRPFLNSRHRMMMMANHVPPSGRTVVRKGNMWVDMWVNPITHHVEPFIGIQVINGRLPKVSSTFTLLEDWRPYVPEPEAPPAPPAFDVGSDDDPIMQSILSRFFKESSPFGIDGRWVIAAVMLLCFLLWFWFGVLGGGQ